MMLRQQPALQCINNNELIFHDGQNMKGQQDEREAMEQAKNLALMYAHAHTKASYITCDSKFGNLILPVVPRGKEERPSREPTTEASKNHAAQ